MLVVDDNDDVAATISTLLETVGYHVARAGSGNHALHAIERLRPAIVVVEWMLRDGSGIGLSRRLAALRMGSLSFVIVGHSTQPAAVVDPIVEAFDAYVQKGSTELLLETLADCVSNVIN